MAYCGKDCAACAERESCPGCQAGPGGVGGGCPIAACAREKGHEACETCSFHGNCRTLLGRSDQPGIRRAKREAALRAEEEAARRAPTLGKWLWALFWLVVPSAVAGILGNENFMQSAPGVYMAGQIASAILSLVYGAILLFKLAPVEAGYRTAGLLALIAGAVNALVVVLTGAAESPDWTLAILIPALVVALVGEYKEYTAHAAVLVGVDPALSEKWTKLWKWHIGCMLGMFGCMVVMLISPILGLLALLAALIGMVVTSILKLAYLYRTAKIFRAYPEQPAPPAAADAD